MNKLFIAATVAALVSSPAFAKTAKTTHPQKHAVSQSQSWLQPSVRGANARYLGVAPTANGQTDLQFGSDYAQRP